MVLNVLNVVKILSDLVSSIAPNISSDLTEIEKKLALDLFKNFQNLISEYNSNALLDSTTALLYDDDDISISSGDDNGGHDDASEDDHSDSDSDYKPPLHDEKHVTLDQMKNIVSFADSHPNYKKNHWKIDSQYCEQNI